MPKLWNYSAAYHMHTKETDFCNRVKFKSPQLLVNNSCLYILLQVRESGTLTNKINALCRCSNYFSSNVVVTDKFKTNQTPNPLQQAKCIRLSNSDRITLLSKMVS